MKKSARAKAPKAAKKEKPDIVGIMTGIKEQMAVLEMKIDVLTERLTIKPPEMKFQPEPPLGRGEFQRPKENRNPFGSSGRVMHKAVCADCNRECEVPFKPREDRAVYCKECFSKRKAGGALKPNSNNARAEEKPIPEPEEPKKAGAKKTKAAGKKKAAKKGKKRA